MDDTEPASQLPGIAKADARAEDDTKKEENKEMARVEENGKPQQAEAKGKGKETEAPADSKSGPSTQEQQPQQQPQQQKPPRRPKGNGPIRRLHMTNNVPFIQQPEPRPRDTEVQGTRRRQAALPPSDTVGPSQEEDGLDTTVQVPDHITVDPELLHVDPPSPEVVFPVKEDEKGKSPIRVPPKFVKPICPISPPDRPPHPLRLARGQHGTTLYEVLDYVNRALAAEIERKPDVGEALVTLAPGPWRPLGLLGSLVHILFESMKQHHRTNWRNKTAAPRSGRWPSSAEIRPGAIPPPLRKAPGMFDIPITQFRKPQPRPTEEAALDSDDEDYEDYDEDGENESGEEKDKYREKHSMLALSREPAPEFDTYGERSQVDPVWEAIQKGDRRRIRYTAKKRSYQETVSSGEDSSSVTETDYSSSEIEFFNLPSPSLPKRMNRDQLFAGGEQELNPRRHATFTIKEKSRKEFTEDKIQRREARAVERKRLQAQKKVQRKAQQGAEATLLKQLADLADERDAALHLAETAVYERDDLRDDQYALQKDIERLRRVVKRLLARVGKEEDSDKSEGEGEGEGDGEGDGDGEDDKASDVRDGVPPAGQAQLQTPVPTVTTVGWDRQKILDEARRILHEATARERTPMPASATHYHTTVTSLSYYTRVTYHIEKTRAPLGTGFFMSFLDIFLSLWLMVVRQKHNLYLVLQWLAFVLLGPVYFDLVDALPRIRSQICQRALEFVSWRQPRPDPGQDAPPAGPQPFPPAGPRKAHPAGSRPPPVQTRFIRFPRDALAELALFGACVLAGLAVIAAVTERNLWVDANDNGERQRRFLYGFVLHHHEDTDSSEVWPAMHGPGPYHICGCVPTLIDSRMLFWTFSYFCSLATHRLWDYARLAGMWLSWATGDCCW